MPYCPNCGQGIQGGMKFCPNCGQDLSIVVPKDQRIPTEDVPVPPPPSGYKGGRGHDRRLLIIVVVIVIVLIILGLLIAVIGNGAGENTPTSSQQESSVEESEESADKKEDASKGDAKEEKESMGSAAQIGETVTVGDASWIVTDAYPTKQINNTYGGALPAKQGDFVVVDFRFTNDGNEAKTLHQQAVQLMDSDGRESDPDTDTFGFIPREKNIFLEQVNPGVSKEGQVIFSVAPGGSGYKLRLKDTNLFRSERNQAEVNLGF